MLGRRSAGDRPLALLDLARRQIDPDEAGVRQLDRHRDQVVAAGAAQFQHAAGVDVGRLQAEEPGKRREAIRVRLRKCLVDVRHFVVAGGNGLGHGSGFLGRWKRRRNINRIGRSGRAVATAKTDGRRFRCHGTERGAATAAGFRPRPAFGTPPAFSARRSRTRDPRRRNTPPALARRNPPASACAAPLRRAQYTFTRVRAEHLALQRRRELRVAVLLTELRARSGTRETPRSGPAASRTRCCRFPTARCPRRRP